MLEDRIKEEMTTEAPPAWANLAEQIKRFADAIEEAQKHVSERLFYLVLRDATGLPNKVLKRVIDVIPRLKRRYLGGWDV